MKQIRVILMAGLFLVLIPLSFACYSPTAKSSSDATTIGSGADTVMSVARRYSKLNDSIQRIRIEFRQKWKVSHGKDSLRLAAASLLHKLIAFDYYELWKGTQWDFYGTAQTPGEGKIACGYFVTTVLRDVGIKIDRVAMAETYSEKMIRTLINQVNIRKYTPFDLVKFVSALASSGDALYLVGLDNHTGFISVESGKVWFIHSSILAPGSVIKEPALESVALQINRYTVCGCLSCDKDLIESWITG